MAAQKTSCGNIQYFTDKKLGEGGFASVFEGFYKGEKVAVKIVPMSKAKECKNEVDLQTKLKHENVLKLLTVIDEGNSAIGYRFIVLELCAGTLEQLINKKYSGPMPKEEQVLYQIASGVQYLHSVPLIHRDIKPGNILISCTDPVVIKVSDFGLSKATSSRGTCSNSGMRGTYYWMAPEVLKLVDLNEEDLAKERGTVKSDIFSTGCVFFYFLTRGIHPFGEGMVILANILKFDPVNIKKLPKVHFAHGLIDKMLKKVDERIALTEVIEILEKRRSYQFKAIEMSVPQISGDCWSRFHPKDQFLASNLTSSSSVAILKAVDGLISSSSWKIEQEFERTILKEICRLEWNVNGTQLAAGCADGTVVVWSYPGGRVIFETNKHSSYVHLIAWNPFRQDVLATRQSDGKELLFWNSRKNGDAEKAHHFLTLDRDEMIRNVDWISANQIAIGLDKDEIEIWEIDDDKGSSRVIKRFRHSEGSTITGLKWNERTNYLASSSRDGWINVWSMASDEALHFLQLDSDCLRFAWRQNVKTDNDGAIDAERKDKENFIIACGLKNGSVFIWNPLEEDESNRKRILPQKHSHKVYSLSFSPDGRFLASTDYRDEMIIWSSETWLPVFACRNDAHSSLSWMSTDSSSVSANKLAVLSKNKILVLEESLTQ